MSEEVAPLKFLPRSPAMAAVVVAFTRSEVLKSSRDMEEVAEVAFKSERRSAVPKVTLAISVLNEGEVVPTPRLFETVRAEVEALVVTARYVVVALVWTTLVEKKLVEVAFVEVVFPVILKFPTTVEEA